MSVFPVMSLESNYMNGLNEEARAACTSIANETETTEHDIKYLSTLAQMPKCHN
jgi:hypothetical protein